MKESYYETLKEIWQEEMSVTMPIFMATATKKQKDIHFGGWKKEYLEWLAASRRTA